MLDENLAPQLHSVLCREKQVEILARTTNNYSMQSNESLTICGFFLDQGCSDGSILHFLTGQPLEAGHDGEVMTVAVRCDASSSSVTAGVSATLTFVLRSIIV